MSTMTTISFEVPEEVERRLRQGGADPSQAAREALLVELYRRAQITHHQLAETLGLGRDEADGLLKRHGVPLELSPEELRGQVESLRGMRGG